MNKWIGIGRVTKDAETKYTQGENPMAISRFTLAVDRLKAGENAPSADFISCVAFGKRGEFMEKYGKKGTKFAVEGRIQTGSYENKDGQKVYTTDIACDNIEFCEKKSDNTQPAPTASSNNGFVNLPEGLDEELPFV